MSQKPNDFRVSTCYMLEPATDALTHPWSTALSGKIIKTLFFIENTSCNSKSQEVSTGPKISVRPSLVFISFTHIIGRKIPNKQC